MTLEPMAVGVVADVVQLDGNCGLDRVALGGKAWSVNAMRAAGLPVPPAVALTTGCCAQFYAAGSSLPDDVWQQVLRGLEFLEDETGRQFGRGNHPLLVSVRSGAPVSMPGMMDTVLNLGITDATADALVLESGDQAYVADTRRRFVEQFQDTVLDGEGSVPADPYEQLRQAVSAVFSSWNSARAKTYREARGIGSDLGTAVTIQAMVFGNLDDRSGTGVLFTRNPNTGEPQPFGEWLLRGQGEDVVSGRVTPQPLSALEESMPDVHAELLQVARTLETNAGDIQDIEFTVESGRLWMLQTRSAKRTAQAAVRIAVQLVDDGLISEDQAIDRVSVEQLEAVRSAGSGSGAGDPLVVGEPACPGLVSGVVVTDPDEAEARADHGEEVILVRSATSPDDLHGMIAALGIVTEYGGMTSHAAVVSRELGRPCVVGCGAGTMALLEGREITIDGATGQVWDGLVASRLEAAENPYLERLLSWMDARASR